MLQPSHTLQDLFKLGIVFVPRASLNHGGWMTRQANLLETMAASYLPVRGSLPMLMHQDSRPPAFLALYEGVLKVETGSLRSYADEREYQALLNEIVRKNERTLVQHRYPESELPASVCRVPPNLLGRLNNKACLSEWVPTPWLLPRQVLVLSGTGYEEPQNWPHVLKAAGSMTSGGGADVRICRSREDWRKALDDFAGAEALVLEEYQAPQKLLGALFVVNAAGEVHYLGSTENELTPDGYVNGNWIDAEAGISPEMEAVGRNVVEKAAQAGYRGVAGVDFLVISGGRSWVIDLNFRCCAGLPALLISESIRREWKRPVMFSSIFFTMLPAAELFYLLREGIKERRLLPLGGYFPASDPPRMVNILFLGNDREEVKLLRRELERRLQKPRHAWR